VAGATPGLGDFSRARPGHFRSRAGEPSGHDPFQRNRQDWIVNSYGEGAVNEDPYYRENLVIGDLPAGEYTILMPFAGALVNFDITINPGRVTFFKFQGRKGFTTELPPTPEPILSPQTQQYRPALEVVLKCC